MNWLEYDSQGFTLTYKSVYSRLSYFTSECFIKHVGLEQVHGSGTFFYHFKSNIPTILTWNSRPYMRDTLKESNSNNRNERVLVCRLRIEHTKLTQSFLLCQTSASIYGSTSSPSCSIYSNERSLSRLHLILSQMLQDDESSAQNLSTFLKLMKLILNI